MSNGYPQQVKTPSVKLEPHPMCFSTTEAPRQLPLIEEAFRYLEGQIGVLEEMISKLSMMIEPIRNQPPRPEARPNDSGFATCMFAQRLAGSAERIENIKSEVQYNLDNIQL